MSGETGEKWLEEILDHRLWLARRRFSEQFIREHEEFLFTLAERCGNKTFWVYEYLPKELVPDHADFLLKIAEYCGDETAWVYEFLPRDLVPEHNDFLLAIAEHCGERTGSTYRYFLRDLTPEQAKQVFQLGKEQGITHFDRYFKNHTFPLEECTLEAITRASSKKPLAVVIHNKNDENEAFADPVYITELLHVLAHYSVCLFETDNRTEVFEDIKRAATTSKKPRKISLLVLGGHGTPQSLNLGKPTHETEKYHPVLFNGECYLSIYDGAQFAEMGKHIRKGGKIVLVSCSTGAEIVGGKNLAQVIAENVPHATIYAPQVDTMLESFVFERGRVADVIYRCGPEQTVKLCGGSSAAKRDEP
ncbi:hypothetical protein HYS49_03470 [Candidatus Woesearchaeota archaeon]|nr:hypothetical protein [Candidatus Woesearchaeota archaeon]